MMFSPQIRRMIEAGTATVGPPVRITKSQDSVIPENRKAQAVDLELPPSTNHLFMNGKKGTGRFKTPEYREWLAVAVPTFAGGFRPVRNFAPFSILYTLHGGAGLNMSRDLGNLEKALTDALVSACIIPGDSLAAGLHALALKFINHDSGAAFVRTEITEGEPSI